MILFRADGNSSIGSGHIMRCIAIAYAAKEKGIDSVFVTADCDANELIVKHGFRAHSLNTVYNDMLSEIDSFKLFIEKEMPEAIVVDSYYVCREYFNELKRISKKCGCIKIVYIDDMLNDIYNCDYLINYGINDDNKEYKYRKKYEFEKIVCPKLLIGTDYVPLRREFRQQNTREHGKKVNNILILTGGSDVTHTAIAIIRYLENITKYNDIRFHFVVGSLNPDRALIGKTAESLDNVIIHENVNNMSELMINADIAISASGTTLFELCACATPIIAYICADNQGGVDALNMLLGVPAAVDARYDNNYVDELFHRIDYLCENYDERVRLSAEENRLVDGLGAARIVKEFLTRTTGGHLYEKS